MSYVSLHNHTVASALDGLNKPDKLAELAKSMGMPALAITDHGTMEGVPEFVVACQKTGIKPIIGLEAYMVPNRREKAFFKTPLGKESRSGYHLTLLAKNLVGFRNLVKLTNISYIHGFYYRPKIDWKDLEAHHEGLIVLSGCVGSELNNLVLAGQMKPAEDLIGKFREVFKDDFFLEIMENLMAKSDQRTAATGVVELARKLKMPVIPTNDTHYLRAEHREFHTLMFRVSRSQDKTKEGATEGEKKKSGGFQHGYDGNYHMKTPEEMTQLFGPFVPNTLAVAERVEAYDIFDKKAKLPSELSDPHNVLVAVARAGLARRGLAGKPEYESRLEREMATINRLGFSNYFLATREIIEIVRDCNCPLGWGRGSGGGSLICYCMDITDIDPIRYNLLFERFISDNRPDWPDIDLDIPQSRRDEILEKMTEKFGTDRVAHIATNNTFRPKALIRDICREYGVASRISDRWSAMAPPLFESYEKDIAGSDLEKELMDEKNSSKLFNPRFILNAFKELIGAHRSVGVHASGIVISNQKIGDYLPVRTIEIDGKNRLVTQYTMNWLDKFGFLKFDILGVQKLDVVYSAAAEIGVDIKSIPTDDPEPFKLISKGQVEGMFQLDASKNCAELCRQIKPATMMELATILAVNRPGVLDSGEYRVYIRRRQGVESVSYVHPDLQTILKDNYGILIFQEDLMQMAVILAGYTLSETENLRKGIGKKDMAVVRPHLDKFIEQATKLGKVDVASIRQVANQIEAAGRYAFNKSHAVGYGYLTYACAWLAAHHSLVFFKWLITLAPDEEDRVKYLSAAMSRGIKILPPDVNRSGLGVTQEGVALRLGIRSVKGIGEATAKEITSHRPYKSAAEVLDAVNRNIYAALWSAGALLNLPDAAKYPPINPPEEADVLGISLRSIEKYRDVVDKIKAVPFWEIEAEARAVVVKVREIKEIKDSHDRKMAFLTVMDMHGPRSEAVMFWEAFKAFPPELEKVYWGVMARTGRGGFQILQLHDIEKQRASWALGVGQGV